MPNTQRVHSKSSCPKPRITFDDSAFPPITVKGGEQQRVSMKESDTFRDQQTEGKLIIGSQRAADDASHASSMAPAVVKQHNQHLSFSPSDPTSLSVPIFCPLTSIPFDAHVVQWPFLEGGNTSQHSVVPTLKEEDRLCRSDEDSAADELYRKHQQQQKLLLRPLQNYFPALHSELQRKRQTANGNTTRIEEALAPSDQTPLLSAFSKKCAKENSQKLLTSQQRSSSDSLKLSATDDKALGNGYKKKAATICAISGSLSNVTWPLCNPATRFSSLSSPSSTSPTTSSPTPTTTTTTTTFLSRILRDTSRMSRAGGRTKRSRLSDNEKLECLQANLDQWISPSCRQTVRDDLRGRKENSGPNRANAHYILYSGMGSCHFGPRTAQTVPSSSNSASLEAAFSSMISLNLQRFRSGTAKILSAAAAMSNELAVSEGAAAASTSTAAHSASQVTSLTSTAANQPPPLSQICDAMNLLERSSNRSCIHDEVALSLRIKRGKTARNGFAACADTALADCCLHPAAPHTTPDFGDAVPNNLPIECSASTPLVEATGEGKESVPEGAVQPTPTASSHQQTPNRHQTKLKAREALLAAFLLQWNGFADDADMCADTDGALATEAHTADGSSSSSLLATPSPTLLLMKSKGCPYFILHKAMAKWCPCAKCCAFHAINIGVPSSREAVCHDCFPCRKRRRVEALRVEGHAHFGDAAACHRGFCGPSSSSLLFTSRSTHRHTRQTEAIQDVATLLLLCQIDADSLTKNRQSNSTTPTVKFTSND